jgi:pimeloyl-ACP methyl ester carboxylesterase
MHRLQVGAQGLVVWEWPGEGAPLLLVHATGFHGRCWDAVARRLPGRRILALDQASHGASAPKPPPYEAAQFGEDLAGVVRAMSLRKVVGVGHSMGGHAMVVAAAREPEAFAGLLLLDPVIVDPALAAGQIATLSAAEHPVGRRRSRWSSVEQMFEAFSQREPYARWDREVLRDYCHFGLRPAQDGSFELACAPHLEVEVYVGIHMRSIFSDIPAVRVPVDVVRARDRRPEDAPLDFSPSPTWSVLASLFPHGRDEQLAGQTHFFPMEAPAWTADRIARFADDHGGGAP